MTVFKEAIKEFPLFKISWINIFTCISDKIRFEDLVEVLNLIWHCLEATPGLVLRRSLPVLFMGVCNAKD